MQEGANSVFNHSFTPEAGSKWPSQELKMDGVQVLAFHPDDTDQTKVKMYDIGQVVDQGRPIDIELTFNMTQGQKGTFDIEGYDTTGARNASERKKIFAGKCLVATQ